MQADYVIVGSGSAGSAMAARLSEAGHDVIVLEFGGTDWGPLIQMPGALSFPMNMPLYDWGYRSEPEPHLGGRRLACPRGKVIRKYDRHALTQGLENPSLWVKGFLLRSFIVVLVALIAILAGWAG